MLFLLLPITPAAPVLLSRAKAPEGRLEIPETGLQLSLSLAKIRPEYYSMTGLRACQGPDQPAKPAVPAQACGWRNALFDRHSGYDLGNVPSRAAAPAGHLVMNEMIVTDNLGKHYQDLVALDGLSLQIPPGEIFGLLGPNGAGKTTTIKILTTLARPSRGSARIQDFDVVRQPLAVKQLIGVCPQEINLDRELTAFENLWIYGRLHRMPDLPARIAELLEFGNLQERADSLVRDFSGGMQRRLLILRALVSRPRVLFLDEPTVGLDPQVRRQLWSLIQELSWRASPLS